MDSGRRAFLGHVGTAAVFAGLDAGFPSWAFAASGTTPESLGISSIAVRAFIDAAEAAPTQELHSMVVARRGRIAAKGWWAPYRADMPHSLYSLSKSFTSTAIGFAVAEGRLKLSERIVDLFPDRVPEKIDDHLGALRVEHLLTMSVGHASDSTPVVTHSSDWIETFLAQPIANAPGSEFLYDSAATYVLSAIVQKRSGEKLVDYLKPRLFDPLGLPRMRWSESPQGVNCGGWGLYATTESIYRFGQLYLDRGRRNGRQILPAAWIDEATSFKIQQPAPKGQDLEALKKTSDWHQGYAYQFWRCRHDAFRGDGAFGQYCIVLPKLDAVVALTGRTLDLQGTLNLVWDHLLPGIQDTPRLRDDGADRALAVRLAALSLKRPAGAAHSARHDKVSTYSIASNTLGIERLHVAFERDACRLEFVAAGRTHRIACGLRDWRDGETSLPGTPPEFTELTGRTVNPPGPAKIAATGAWKDADTFVTEWRYIETPHFDTVTLKFDGEHVEVAFLNSLTQMAAAVHPETRPTLKGRKA